MRPRLSQKPAKFTGTAQKSFFLGLVFFSIFLCGGEEGSLPLSPTEDGKLPEITIENPIIRLVPPEAPATAGFMEIKNTGGPDRLVSVRSDRFGSIQIHEMVEKDGIMRMRELKDGILISENSSLRFAPGGAHLMLESFSALKDGEEIYLDLFWERSGKKSILFRVEEK